MIKIPALIRLDKEFSVSVATALREFIANKPKPIIINGLSGGSESAYLSEAIRELYERTKAPSLVLVGNTTEAEGVVDALRGAGISVFEFKPRELIFYNISASSDIDRERLLVLSRILRGEAMAIVTTPDSLLGYTIPSDTLAEACFSLSVGDEYSLASLSSKLSVIGYKRVDMVEARGQFSLRGDILDIWTGVEDNPTRVEFFGDEVDRISSFDPETQRSLDSLTSLFVTPSCEVVLDSDAVARVISHIDRLLSCDISEETRAKLTYERTMLEGGATLPSRDKYINIIYGGRGSLLSYLQDYPRIFTFILGTNDVKESLTRAEVRLKETIASIVADGLIGKENAKYSHTGATFDRFLDESVTLHLNSFAGGVHTLSEAGLFGFRCRRTTPYGGNGAMLIEDIRALRRSLYRIIILTENKMGADSLISSLASEDIYAIPIYDKDDFDVSGCDGGVVLVGVGKYSGFELITPRLAVLSMERPEGAVVMEKRRQKRILRRVGGAGERLMSYADLSLGDYVVHANYGIGLFEGIETVTIDGVKRDYITIRYAGTDKLFVPCDRLELIGKYIGERDSDGKVKLSKMGGGDWHRAKARAKNAARDIARDLIRIYAERQRLPGFAFPPDTELEDEFAASFEYPETNSQLIAIEEIKKDMMRPVPMNRLLLGDVGFGKTEVALRAAFKAIMGGKQVAILVPTTILALQHFTTALSRMRNYPVTVEMISRFRTPKEEAKIRRKVARGEVDILIGTHKLLSKKVEFRDLGLLIIDEEQRFGVAQKEKLRDMAKCVDTLTLSATPIPRTLNMAMNGIADMSILDEAPGERRPVQTYVLEYDEAIIIDACQRELARGGQVLYLYNKVEGIEFVASKLQRALPDARIATAHGQMDKDELEDIWQSLVKCEIDILVCTTIIETGVDLPTANTLIIEDSDKMGLSQLHQIRGRVGRSERQAYAYFTYRPGKALTDIAKRRLSAIRDFASFGAGFKVALRDLEIRGAGNLLGAEQHGYIESVGYDLYVKLLSEAVLEEQGKTPESSFESAIDIKVSAYIPEKYITVSSQRMEMYKKISLIRCYEDMTDTLDELIDRFGEPPCEIKALLTVALLRALASSNRIKRVEWQGSSLIFTPAEVKLGIWSELFSTYPQLSMRGAVSPVISYRLKRGDSPLDIATEVLNMYDKIRKEEEKENEEK